MPRELLVFGHKTFKITIPDGAKVTFGPWSPPTKDQRYSTSPESLSGTLRVYDPKGRATENILAVFSGVRGFRDLSLGYAEEVAKEEGATIWKDDKDGYVRESSVKRSKEWTIPEVPLLGDADEEE